MPKKHTEPNMPPSKAAPRWARDYARDLSLRLIRNAEGKPMIEAIGMKLMMLTNFEASMEGTGRKGLGTLFREYACAYAATPNIYDFVSQEAAALLRAEFPFKPNAGMAKGYMEPRPESEDIYF